MRTAVVERIELDPIKRVGKLHMKKFPMPVEDIGNLFRLVTGARSAHQKRKFPPIDVIDIQFEYQGKALIPIECRPLESAAPLSIGRTKCLS